MSACNMILIKHHNTKLIKSNNRMNFQKNNKCSIRSHQMTIGSGENFTINIYINNCSHHYKLINQALELLRSEENKTWSCETW